MIGHLGSRVSDLLDGRLDAVEEERAWDHVHACHLCRDLVEREGWVKTRLAYLSLSADATAPASLKGSLLDAALLVPPGEAYLMATGRPRTRATLAAVGGGALGAAVFGLVALAASPAAAPVVDRRTPGVTVRQSTPAPASVGGAVGGHRREVGHLSAIQDKMSW